MEPGTARIYLRGVSTRCRIGCATGSRDRGAPGDRVGIYLRKSIDAVAAIFGDPQGRRRLRAGRPGRPPARNAYILDNCAVAAIVIERAFAERFRAELEALGAAPPIVVVDGRSGGGGTARGARPRGCRAARACRGNGRTERPTTSPTSCTRRARPGKPKGVMLSHENAVELRRLVLGSRSSRTPDDRFSSHAPFHFDLSILDIYVSLKHGATLVLIGEENGKEPQRLAQLIADERITVWYSAPSILSLLAQFGKLERARLFARCGWCCSPARSSRSSTCGRLQALLAGPRYFNLYGPTETNVCTFYEVASADSRRSAPMPYPDRQTLLASATARSWTSEGDDVARGRGRRAGASAGAA